MIVEWRVQAKSDGWAEILDASLADSEDQRMSS